MTVRSRIGAIRPRVWSVAARVGAPIKLVARLLRDERVDSRARLLVGAAAAYAVIPIDLIPDRIPLIGTLDDVVAVLLALHHLLDAAPPEVVEEHWDGTLAELDALRRRSDQVADLMPRRVRRAFAALT